MTTLAKCGEPRLALYWELEKGWFVTTRLPEVRVVAGPFQDLDEASDDLDRREDAKP